MKNSSEKFTGKADAYSLARPAYPKKFLDDLYEEFGCSTNSVIADIGSGTGKLTRMLLEKGNKVFAIEPNADMREKAESQLNIYKNFYSINACAENTTLSDKSIDFITVAQAFHWFDTPKFKTECRRISKPQTKVFLIWNTRDEKASINIDSAKIFQDFCPDFVGFQGGIKENDKKINDFFDGKYGKKIYENNIEYNKESFIARYLSSSYSLKSEDKDYSKFLQNIQLIFDKYAINGKVFIPNNTQVYFNL